MAGGTLKNIEVLNDGAFALRAADYVSAKALAASTAESITEPENATHVLLAGTEHFYANFTTTAVVPTDTDDGTSNEPNPDMRICRGLSPISVLTAASAGAVVPTPFWRSLPDRTAHVQGTGASVRVAPGSRRLFT